MKFKSRVTGSWIKLNLQGQNFKYFWSKIAPTELRFIKYRKNGFSQINFTKDLWEKFQFKSNLTNSSKYDLNFVIYFLIYVNSIKSLKIISYLKMNFITVKSMILPRYRPVTIFRSSCPMVTLPSLTVPHRPWGNGEGRECHNDGLMDNARQINDGRYPSMMVTPAKISIGMVRGQNRNFYSRNLWVHIRRY